MTQTTNRDLRTRRSLLSRVRNWEDHDSWAEFERTYGSLIYSTARRAGLSDADAKDVRQNTLLAVSKAMLKFNYDPAQGSFKGWLLKTTTWKIRDHISRVQMKNVASSSCRHPEDDRTATVERVADPASVEFGAEWDGDYRNTVYRKALENVRRRVRPKTFQLFELLMDKQWPVSKITAALDVTRATVHLAKFRISRLIAKEARRLEKEVM